MGKEERRDKCGGTQLTWMNNHLLLLPLFPAFLLLTFYSFSIHLCFLSIWLFLSIAVFLSRCAQPQPPDSTLQTDLPRSVVGVLTDLLWVDSTIECESLGREEEEGKKGWSGISWWKEVGIRWWQGQEGRGGGWAIEGRETTRRLRVRRLMPLQRDSELEQRWTGWKLCWQSQMSDIEGLSMCCFVYFMFRMFHTK